MGPAVDPGRHDGPLLHQNVMVDVAIWTLRRHGDTLPRLVCLDLLRPDGAVPLVYIFPEMADARPLLSALRGACLCLWPVLDAAVGRKLPAADDAGLRVFIVPLCKRGLHCSPVLRYNCGSNFPSWMIRAIVRRISSFSLRLSCGGTIVPSPSPPRPWPARCGERGQVRGYDDLLQWRLDKCARRSVLC